MKQLGLAALLLTLVLTIPILFILKGIAKKLGVESGDNTIQISRCNWYGLKHILH